MKIIENMIANEIILNVIYIISNGLSWVKSGSSSLKYMANTGYIYQQNKQEKAIKQALLKLLLLFSFTRPSDYIVFGDLCTKGNSNLSILWYEHNKVHVKVRSDVLFL